MDIEAIVVLFAGLVALSFAVSLVVRLAAAPHLQRVRARNSPLRRR